MIRRLFAYLIYCRPYGHDWKYDEHNSAKRTCNACKRHEWMFMRSYPSSEHPSIRWVQMYDRGAG